MSEVFGAGLPAIALSVISQMLQALCLCRSYCLSPFGCVAGERIWPRPVRQMSADHPECFVSFDMAQYIEHLDDKFRIVWLPQDCPQ